MRCGVEPLHDADTGLLSGRPVEQSARQPNRATVGCHRKKSWLSGSRRSPRVKPTESATWPSFRRWTPGRGVMSMR